LGILGEDEICIKILDGPLINVMPTPNMQNLWCFWN